MISMILRNGRPGGPRPCGRPPARAPAVLASALAALVASGCGQLYIHSDASESLAREARSGFQGVVDKNHAGALAQQIRLDQAFAVDVMSDLGVVSAHTQLDTFLSQTWGELLTKTEGQLARAGKRAGTAVDVPADAKKQLAETVGKLAVARADAVAADNAVDEARCQAVRYAATQDLLAGVAGIGVDGSGTPTLKDVLGKRVDGFEDQDRTSCKGQATVGALLGLDGLAVLEGLTDPAGRGAAVAELLQKLGLVKELGSDTRLTLSDPGISSTILGLGYDLARATELRLKAEADYWEKVIQLQTERTEFAKAWEDRLADDLSVDGVDLGGFVLQASSLPVNRACRSRFGLTGRSEGDHLKAQTVGATLRAMAGDYVKARDAFAASDAGCAAFTREYRDAARSQLALGLVVAARSYENLYVLSVKDAEYQLMLDILETTRRAVRAEANLKEREAVIGRGLDGLVAFHEGGINGDDVKSLIGLAQFAGLLAIAEGQ